MTKWPSDLHREVVKNITKWTSGLHREVVRM